MTLFNGFAWTRAAAYASSKLAAAGTVFLGFLALTAGLDLVEMAELTREFPLWAFVYGYAVLFAVVVDAALWKLKRSPAKAAFTLLLYILGGVLPFLAWYPSQWLWVLFGGFYGVACSLTFLGAALIYRAWWPYSGAAAVLLLAASLYVSMADFTVTEQWSENRSADGYQAKFDYFHGKKEIPIELERGQTLFYRIDWRISNGGGYGYGLKGEGVSSTNDVQDDGEWMGYQVDEPSTVRIVVTGRRAQGEFAIAWRITGDGGGNHRNERAVTEL
ncbi:hypothetical protein [Paenibacillus xanthanilyticus]|uniref:Uncharacterized protein n=1 Tax=Paenibacillus xanthanilyticus TaxID=1783531 RepID=A0ABV8K1H2_9BACL